MNIFYTSSSPKQCAYDHCDRHLTKLIVESAQMLSTAHHMLDGSERATELGLYKKTHYNHPSSVWTRSSKDNYMWLWHMLYYLCENYTAKTGKHHKTCLTVLTPLVSPPASISNEQGFAPPPQAMPDEYKSSSDTTQAYHDYLNAKYTEWLSRERPLKVEWYHQQIPHWVNVL